ncbi:MAG: helix-turn-helix domain-containing protein [Neobacillus sp.]
MDIKLLVGKNIRKARKHQKLTQADLASLLKLSRTSIATWRMANRMFG